MILENVAIHAALSAAAGAGGYWAFKNKNRDMALLCSSSQPSIAIALSLLGLGATFGDMNSSDTTGVYVALSMKMYHMVAGIGLGVLQEIATTHFMPLQDEEKRAGQSIKEAVMEGVEMRLSDIDHRVERVSFLLEKVPERVDSSNNAMIRKNEETIQKTASQILQGTNDMYARATDSVNKGLKDINSTVTTVKSDVENILCNTRTTISNEAEDVTKKMRREVEGILTAVKHESDSITNRMKDDLAIAAVSFGNNLKVQSKEIADAAASQGGQVILDVAAKVAKTLETTTNNSLAASIKISNATAEVERAAIKLRDTQLSVN